MILKGSRLNIDGRSESRVQPRPKVLDGLRKVWGMFTRERKESMAVLTVGRELPIADECRW